MGTVIGPITKEDFFLMGTARSNVKFYKQTDRTRYAEAIDSYTEVYYNKLKPYIEVA